MINSENIRTIIEDVVAGFDASRIEDDQTFKQAGIDSLDHINILLAIEESHNVKIPDEDVKQCNSIAAILKYLS